MNRVQAALCKGCEIECDKTEENIAICVEMLIDELQELVASVSIANHAS